MLPTVDPVQRALALTPLKTSTSSTSPRHPIYTPFVHPSSLHFTNITTSLYTKTTTPLHTSSSHNFPHITKPLQTPTISAEHRTETVKLARTTANGSSGTSTLRSPAKCERRQDALLAVRQITRSLQMPHVCIARLSLTFFTVSMQWLLPTQSLPPLTAATLCSTAKCRGRFGAWNACCIIGFPLFSSALSWECSGVINVEPHPAHRGTNKK